MGLLTDDEVAAMVETVNELANATLLEIATPGPLQGNGDPGEPVSVWTGEAKGVLDLAVKEATSGERERQERSVTFHVYDQVAPDELLAGGAVPADSTVVIRDEQRPTPTTSRWTVKGLVKETEGTLDGITLELRSEETP